MSAKDPRHQMEDVMVVINPREFPAVGVEN